MDDTFIAKSAFLSNKKILFIFGNLELGGAERQGFLLAKYFKDECGALVQIWGLQEAPGRLSQLCEEAGILWRGISFVWPGRFHLLIKELVKLTRLIRAEKPDILMPYIFNPNISTGLIWRFTGSKLCIWNQEDEGLFLTENLWHRLSVWLTPCFISNSTGGKSFLVNTYRISTDKIKVIHNGVSLPSPCDDRIAWRKRLCLSDDCFVACMLANIHQYKDHMTLIRAWRVLLDRVKGDSVAPVLLLAGRLDEGEKELRMLATDIKLGDAVRFIGKVDDVSGLLHAVNLSVHSSKSEGLPNAVLEAMEAGLPVVATDIPGIREAVGPVGYRFLASPGDSKGLADRIEEFFREPALCIDIGGKMRQRVHEEFDLPLMCRRTVSFIAENWPIK